MISYGNAGLQWEDANVSIANKVSHIPKQNTFTGRSVNILSF